MGEFEKNQGSDQSGGKPGYDQQQQQDGGKPGYDQQQQDGGGYDEGWRPALWRQARL